MMLIQVNSTAIRAVGYDGYRLTVEFQNGRTYDHPGVPGWVFEEFIRSSSKGTYYNEHIRGKYK
jgi:KTSC domain